MTKVTTVRVDDDLNDEVNAIARADGVSTAELVRTALYRYVADRRSDPQLQARVREALAKDAEVLERLATGGSA
jgi:predicted transcriptional regulator